MEEEIDQRTTDSDGESSNRPGKVLRLDWEWCLCHSFLGGFVEEALAPFSAVSSAKFREAASSRTGYGLPLIGHEGLWNDVPRGYYNRNCFKSCTLPSGLRRAKHERTSTDDQAKAVKCTQIVNVHTDSHDLEHWSKSQSSSTLPPQDGRGDARGTRASKRQDLFTKKGLCLICQEKEKPLKRGGKRRRDESEGLSTCAVIQPQTLIDAATLRQDERLLFSI